MSIYPFVSFKEKIMKAGIIITGTGPILILTSYKDFSDPDLIEKLQTKGIKKFIAFEVPENLCRQRYGKHFDLILGDLHQTDDLRVLDYNGYTVLHNFSFKELGAPYYHE
jgi:hypothetical protein